MHNASDAAWLEAMNDPQMSFCVYLYSYPGQHHRDIPGIHNKHLGWSVWIFCANAVGNENEVVWDVQSQICQLAFVKSDDDDEEIILVLCKVRSKELA